MFTSTDHRAAYAISSPLNSYVLFYIMYYPFYTFVSQGRGSVNEHMFRNWTRWSSSGWSDHLSDRLHRQPTGLTTQHSLLLSVHFIADQLVGLLIAWASSSATLGTPRCSDSLCKRRQLSWGLPWWSDLATSHRCAIKYLHVVRIRVLILGSTSGVLWSTWQMTLASFH